MWLSGGITATYGSIGGVGIDTDHIYTGRPDTAGTITTPLFINGNNSAVDGSNTGQAIMYLGDSFKYYKQAGVSSPTYNLLLGSTGLQADYTLSSTGDYLWWNGSTLKLKGSIEVTGDSNFATTGQVQAASAAAYSQSISYADKIANGTYPGSTFISQNSIISPIIAGVDGYFNSYFKVGSGGIVLDGNNKRMYIGNGNYGNTDTGFYASYSGWFSLADKLTYNPSTGLAITGAITVQPGGNAATVANVTDAYNNASGVADAVARGNYTGAGTSFISGKSIFSPYIAGASGYIGGTFTVGQAPNHILFDGINKKMYIGNGNYANGDTPFYADGTGQFSLGARFTWDTSSNLTVGNYIGNKYLQYNYGSNTLILKGAESADGITITSNQGMRYVNDNGVFTITGGSANGVNHGAQIDFVGTGGAGAGSYGLLSLNAGWPDSNTSDGRIRFGVGNAGTNGYGEGLNYEAFTIWKDGLVEVGRDGSLANSGNLQVDNDIHVHGYIYATKSAQFYQNVAVNGQVAVYNNADYTIQTGTGNLTSGGTVNFQVDYNGNVNATSFNPTSTRKVKNNIRPLSTFISNPLNTLSKLEGIVYDSSLFPKVTNQIGYIAEDVYQVIPEIVQLDENNEPKALDYSRITVVLVEAIKQLNDKITSLQNTINSK